MTSDFADSPAFHALLNGSLDPIGIVNASGRYTWVNDAGVLFLGFERSELIGTHFTELLADDEGPGDAMRRARLGRPAATVRRIRRKDQTVVVMRTELIPLGDGGEVLIHGTDLSVLYETLDRVSESEAVLARAQEIGHTGSWVLRLSDQTVRWFGPLGDLVGAPSGSVISGGAIADQLVHPEDRPLPTAIVRDAIAEGHGVGVFRVVLNGELHWLRMYAQAGRDDRTGEITRVEGVVHDITELREQDERYRELLDAVRVPMVIWTAADGETPSAIRYVNPPLCALVGMDAEAMMGARPSAWLEEEDRSALTAAMERVAQGERLPPVQIRVRRADNSYATCLLVTARVTYESRDALCAQLIDISEEVRLRALAVRSRDTDLALAVASGVAHDFNNLLTGVLGYLELAAAEVGEDSPAARVVEAAQLAARRAANLAHALLGFSRGGAAGASGAPVAVVDVTDVVREAYAITRATIDHSVTMTTNEGARPVHAAIAADNLLRVLVNLIVNARDAAVERAAQSETGYRPRIDIGVDLHGTSDTVEIWVADNGVGIPDEIRGRIFEPYFSTKTASGGSGIGLRAARDLAVGAGGDLTFRTQVGVGTRFTLSLPLVSAPVALDL